MVDVKELKVDKPNVTFLRVLMTFSNYDFERETLWLIRERPKREKGESPIRPSLIGLSYHWFGHHIPNQRWMFF